jgi:hypothetical protein
VAHRFFHGKLALLERMKKIYLFETSYVEFNFDILIVRQIIPSKWREENGYSSIKRNPEFRDHTRRYRRVLPYY